MNLTTEELIELAKAGDIAAREQLEILVGQGNLDAAKYIMTAPAKPAVVTEPAPYQDDARSEFDRHKFEHIPPYQDEELMRAEITRILKGSEFEGQVEEQVGTCMCLWNPELINGLKKIPTGDRKALWLYLKAEVNAQYLPKTILQKKARQTG